MKNIIRNLSYFYSRWRTLSGTSIIRTVSKEHCPESQLSGLSVKNIDRTLNYPDYTLRILSGTSIIRTSKWRTISGLLRSRSGCWCEDEVSDVSSWGGDTKTAKWTCNVCLFACVSRSGQSFKVRESGAKVIPGAILWVRDPREIQTRSVFVFVL